MNIWRTVFLSGLILSSGGCGNGSNDQHAASTDPSDACTLVSQKEMEQFMGPLLEYPYRVTDRHPDPHGDSCLYRARDYRNVTLELHRKDGGVFFRMVAGNSAKLENALSTSADRSVDTLNVDWDKVGDGFGRLTALKGPDAVQIDPLGSRLDLVTQAKIMSIAIGRLNTPLKYDGGRAARQRKIVAMAPRNPCFHITRKEAEALMGKLRADPHPSEKGDACIFPVDVPGLAKAGFPMNRELDVQWSDGFYSLGQARQSMGLAHQVMTKFMGPTEGEIPKLGENTVGEKEPWDERLTYLGGNIAVVKHDVLLDIPADDVNGFDEQKALELLRMVAKRI